MQVQMLELKQDHAGSYQICLQIQEFSNGLELALETMKRFFFRNHSSSLLRAQEQEMSAFGVRSMEPQETTTLLRVHQRLA